MSQTVEEFLNALPEDRRAVVSEVRKLIRKNLPKGYEEGIGWNMLCYTVPLSRYPRTYNGQPLAYVALASQKNYCSLYLTCAYSDPVQAAALREGFAKAGKKLDMGKSCVRFKTTDDLALDAIARHIASTPPDAFIALYEAVRTGVTAAKASATKAKPKAKRA